MSSETQKPTTAQDDVQVRFLISLVASLERARDTALNDCRTLAAECRVARECVGPDEIYGWDEPRTLNDGKREWYVYQETRLATDAARLLEKYT